MTNTIACIDNGFYSTVIFSKSIPQKLYSFRSKAQQIDIPIKASKTYHLIINNVSYIIGNAAESIDINIDKTNSNLHLLTTLTALGLLGSDSFKLVANIPLNYYSKENKQKFEDRFKSQRNISFLLNSQPKNISIIDCVVFPQCLSVLYANNIKSSIVAILDIGGLTCQGVICENNNIVQSSIFSENLGTLILMNKIKHTLNKEFNLNLQNYQIEDVIKNGIPNKPEVKSIIDSCCKSHFQQIIQTIKLAGWDINSLYILMTGGGSLLLEKYIKLPNYSMSINPVNDNCLGLWEVGKYVYNI